MKFQSLREVWTITEWRDGCVYNTRSNGYAWVTLDFKSDDVNTVFGSISSKVSSKLRASETFRKVSDDTPDVVSTTIRKDI